MADNNNYNKCNVNETNNNKDDIPINKEINK